MNTYNITFSRIFEETRQLTADNKEEAKSKLKRDLGQEFLWSTSMDLNSSQ